LNQARKHRRVWGVAPPKSFIQSENLMAVGKCRTHLILKDFIFRLPLDLQTLRFPTKSSNSLESYTQFLANAATFSDQVLLLSMMKTRQVSLYSVMKTWTFYFVKGRFPILKTIPTTYYFGTLSFVHWRRFVISKSSSSEFNFYITSPNTLIFSCLRANL